MRTKVLSLLCILLCLLAAGCVSKSTYEQKVAEADQLLASRDGLQETLNSLKQDHQNLTDEKRKVDSTLAKTQARLDACNEDLERAQKDIQRLEDVLTTRSAEAGAAMTEMRQTIDALQTEKRGLENQLEREKIAREARLAQMKNTYDQLVGKLENEIQRGEVTISELQGRLTVNMVERILFDSGRAEVKPEGLDVLRRVGNILNEAQDKVVQVEGHTDSVPISGRLVDRFPTNWELSTARAANVVHFLQDQVGIPGERLAVTGYGPYRPIAGNDTPEGREQNRRIQIVLIPAQGRVVEPTN